MSGLDEAWRKYRDGNFDRAARLFSDDNSVQGIAGRALSLLAMGRGDDAVRLIDGQLDTSSQPDLTALLADVMGRGGNRQRARQKLQRLTSRHPDRGFYHTLLGEQRIRMGQWDEGADDFITGLDTGDARAIAHLKKVVTDMVDAVDARRIPPEDALRFINRVDYSTTQNNQDLNRFFAAARRALNEGRRMRRRQLHEPWSVAADTGPAAATKPDRPPGRSAPPPQAADRPPKAPPRQPSSSPPSKSDDSSLPGSNRSRLAQRSQAPDVQPDASIDARRKDMTVVMEQERSRNEQLQDLVAAVDPPTWPSNYETPIDTIEPIGFSTESLLRASNDIETANFRVTGGDISVEIGLERCMHNLMAAAMAGNATTLPLTRESIPRLELNLLDDFVDRMPELDDLYLEQMKIDRPDVMGVGKFIGECIVQSYGGSWHYDIPARGSVIHLGDHKLDPIGLAAEFFDTDDFDSVNLRRIIYEAERAVKTSTAFPTFADYVDSTSGLFGEALQLILGELWVGYRFALDDTRLQEVGTSLRVIEEHEQFVAFSLPAEFVPSALVSTIAGAVDSEQRVPMAYLRTTGEFLVLPSSKHFARLLEITRPDRSQDVTNRLANWIQQWFRPGWTVVTGEEAAEQCRTRHGLGDLKLPRLSRSDSATTIRMVAVDAQATVHNLAIEHRPGQQPPYRLV